MKIWAVGKFGTENPMRLVRNRKKTVKEILLQKISLNKSCINFYFPIVDYRKTERVFEISHLCELRDKLFDHSLIATTLSK